MRRRRARVLHADSCCAHLTRGPRFLHLPSTMAPCPGRACASSIASMTCVLVCGNTFACSRDDNAWCCVLRQTRRCCDDEHDAQIMTADEHGTIGGLQHRASSAQQIDEHGHGSP